MSLTRLARELDETARQTAEMVDGITRALELLSEGESSCDSARKKAVQQIIVTLQGQDRIEQRCRGMAEVVRRLVERDGAIDHPRFDELWAHMTLDELAVPELSGIAARSDHGEVDLF